MSKRYEELEKLAAGLATDLRKFYDDGNKAAGTRARKGLMTLENWAHEVYKEISAQKRAPDKKVGTHGIAERAKQPGVDVILDETGVRVDRSGAWRENMYGGGERRQWVKIHVALDGEGGMVLSVGSDGD